MLERVFSSRVTLLLITAILKTGSVNADSGKQACACAATQLSASFSSATQIFDGVIVGAQLDDRKQLVDFTVDVDSVYRGAVETEMRLRTSLVDECRVRIYAGTTLVFLLESEDQVLTSCMGSYKPVDSTMPYVSMALDLVENYDASRSSLNTQLRAILASGQSASMIRSVLTFAARLDPDAPSTNAVTTLAYRGLSVTLEDEKVVSYEWR